MPKKPTPRTTTVLLTPGELGMLEDQASERSRTDVGEWDSWLTRPKGTGAVPRSPRRSGAPQLARPSGSIGTWNLNWAR
ncbi:hypothetical protein [Streptomyces murinus]|uniref:hypothetical protein n=1 Tax=Streptomyces murinus TaxID=33900 RepID=UPI0038154C0C